VIRAGNRGGTRRRIDIWTGSTRVDQIALLDEVEQLGVVVEGGPGRERHPCRSQGDAGAESLSDGILAILAKGHTRADVDTALELARGAGITLRPTWVAFTPWTALDDYTELLDFIQERDLIDAVDPVQMSIRLLVPPGSLLESHQAFLPHRGRLDAQRFTWTWKHPDPRMDLLHANVAAIVERAAVSGRDARATFARIGAAVRHFAGGSSAGAALPDAVDLRDAATSGNPVRRPPSPMALTKGRPPRLTEPWFC